MGRVLGAGRTGLVRPIGGDGGLERRPGLSHAPTTRLTGGVVEPPPKDLVYEKGVVAMAKTQTEPAGASGSQFFVVTAEDAGLPPEYALLGRVTAGQDVVDRIGVAETDPATEAPIDPVVIKSITVATK